MATLRTLETRLGLNTAGFTSGLTAAERAAKGFDKGLNGYMSRSASTIMNLVGIGGGLAGAVMAVKAAFNFAREGEQLNNLARSFDDLAERAGADSRLVMAALQDMSGGMLSQSQLMGSYNKTALLMGTEMAGEVGRMIRLATVSAAAGMGDLNYLLESLSLGIGRESKVIIDNLGYTVDLEAVYARAAQSLGKTADELTAVERKMALLNDIESQAVDRFGDLDEAARNMAGAGMARLQASTQNYIDLVKRDLGPTVDDMASRLDSWLNQDIAGTDEHFARTLQSLEMGGRVVSGEGNWWDELTTRGTLLAERIRNAITPGDQTGFSMSIEELVADMNVAAMSADEFAQKVAQVAAVNEEAAAVMWRERIQALELASELGKTTARERALAGATEGATAAMGDQAARAASLKRALSGLGGMAQSVAGSMAALNRQMARQERERSGGVLPGRNEYEGGLEGTLAWLADTQSAYSDTYDDALGKMADANASFADSTASALSDAQRDWESYVGNWNSTVESMLQPSMDYGQDDFLDRIGLHENTPDEAARRMAALMQDPVGTMKQDWFGGFAAQFAVPTTLPTDQIQAFAAQWLNDFEAGLHPEAIDWNTFIANYQQAMQEQTAQAELFETAKSKLIEAGLGPDSALVMQALGYGGAAQGITMGTQLSETFGDAAGSGLGGAAEQNVSDYASEFQTQLDGKYDQFKTAGEGIGEALAEGINGAIDSGVTGIVTTITKKVLEAVVDYLANAPAVP
jgi:hypothetical protein